MEASDRKSKRDMVKRQILYEAAELLGKAGLLSAGEKNLIKDMIGRKGGNTVGEGGNL